MVWRQIDDCPTLGRMLRGTEGRNRRMLRARDAMDRAFAQPLDIPALALLAHSSPAGVEFTQEPTERFYGTDCALRDQFGNPIRFTQPSDGPIVVPSAEELRAQA